MGKEVTLQQSGDRDPNGKQERHQEEPNRDLSKEEVEKAIELLKKIPGMESSSLNISMSESQHGWVILVKTSTGEVVKRLAHNEIWHVLNGHTKKTGHILDKSA